MGFFSLNKRGGHEIRPPHSVPPAPVCRSGEEAEGRSPFAASILKPLTRPDLKACLLQVLGMSHQGVNTATKMTNVVGRALQSARILVRTSPPVGKKRLKFEVLRV